jgi:hypothetical protein
VQLDWRRQLTDECDLIGQEVAYAQDQFLDGLFVTQSF